MPLAGGMNAKVKHCSPVAVFLTQKEQQQMDSLAGAVRPR